MRLNFTPLHDAENTAQLFQGTSTFSEKIRGVATVVNSF